MTGHCIICSFDWPNYNCMANEEGSLPSSFLIANTDQRKSKCISPFSSYWSWDLNKDSVHTCDLPFLSHEQWQFAPEQYFISISSTRLWQNCWMMTSHSSTWPLWQSRPPWRSSRIDCFMASLYHTSKFHSTWISICFKVSMLVEALVLKAMKICRVLHMAS